MKTPAPQVIVDLRIPGRWSEPRELIERLPAGCRVMPDSLVLPDGARFELNFMPPDGQFPDIFRNSCRQPPTEEELATVDGYAVNVGLSGEGGSMDAARAIMEAAAVLVRAGGAGVFIDNSGLAHGGKLWLEMTEDGGPDALSFAFASIIQSKEDLWTVGLHVLGLRDIVIKRADVEEGFDIVEMIRYLARGDKPVGEGHIIADLDGPRFQCRAEECDRRLARTPMHNPFGRFRLVSMRDITTSN